MKKQHRIIAAVLAVLLLGGLATGIVLYIGKETPTKANEEAREAIFNREPVDPPDTSDFKAGEAFDTNGYFVGIKATDIIPSLPEYLGIRIPNNIHSITEADIDAEIAEFMETYSITEIMDRAIVDGDWVDLDYVGSIDGVEFEGGNSYGMGARVLAGSDQFIDDFLIQIIGAMPGDELTLNVSFPDPYPNAPELAGKPAVFEVVINHIIEDGEMTDAIVQENFGERFGWETITEMREGVRDLLHKDVTRGFVVNFLDTHLMEILEDVVLPEFITTYITRLMAAFMQSEADMYGMALNDYLWQAMGVSDFGAALEMYAESNHNESVWMLLIQAIAETEGMVVSDEDVADYVYEQSGSRDYAEAAEMYGIGYLKQTVLVTNVIDYIVSKAVLE